MHRLAFCLLLMVPDAALACQRTLDTSETISPAAAAAQAQQIIRASGAIIDAVVMTPHGNELKPAILKPVRILKGPKLERFEVLWEPSACQAPIEGKGRQVRVLLTEVGPQGQPKRYWMAEANLNDPDYAAAVDKALGLPRR